MNTGYWTTDANGYRYFVADERRTRTLRHPIFDRPDETLDLDASAATFVELLRARLPGTAGVRLEGHTAVVTGWTADMQLTLEAMYDDDNWLSGDAD